MGGVDGLVGEPARLVLLVVGRLGHHFGGVVRCFLVLNEFWFFVFGLDICRLLFGRTVFLEKEGYFPEERRYI